MSDFLLGDHNGTWQMVQAFNGFGCIAMIVDCIYQDIQLMGSISCCCVGSVSLGLAISCTVNGVFSS